MNRSAHGSIKSAATVRLSKSFQSKMDKMSERLYDIVKSGFMIKRAQNKKRFTPVNYKQRWFELTKRTLSYFDVESVEIIITFAILIVVDACTQILASIEKL
uniref:PH domain-containing protein n=1 Tax=Glossina palpalis gambiensis TaxID=67801 RepID=A0A1B0BLA2_9MUSC